MARTTLAARQVEWRNTLVPATIAADQVAYSPSGLSTAGGWQATSDQHDRAIRSLAAGQEGRLLLARNAGSNRILLTHEDSAETNSSNRFALEGGRDFVWYPGQCLLLWYTASRWRIAAVLQQPPAITPAVLSADQINWLPSDSSTGINSFVADRVRASSSATVTIRSLQGGYANRRVFLDNVGANSIVLSHEDATAGVTAAARFSFGGHDQILLPGDSAYLGYDAATSRWRRLDGLKPFRVYAKSASAFTLANSTAAQRLLNVSTNGAILLPGDSTFKFKCAFDVSGMSSTSGNLRFSLQGAGTAVLSNIKYTSYGLDNSVPANAGALSGLLSNVSQHAGGIATASAGTAVFANIEGTFSIAGTAGTLIPSVSLVTAVATAVVSAGAWIEIEKIGAGTPAIVGVWT